MTLGQAVSAEIRARIHHQQGKALTASEIGAALHNRQGQPRSQNYVSIRLRGEAAFSIDEVEAIARLLGISPAEIVLAAARGQDVQRHFRELLAAQRGVNDEQRVLAEVDRARAQVLDPLDPDVSDGSPHGADPASRPGWLGPVSGGFSRQDRLWDGLSWTR